MNISSSIRHRFHIEIPHQKLVNISSIMKGEFTSKRDVGSTFKIDETSTILHEVFLMSFSGQIDVNSKPAV